MKPTIETQSSILRLTREVIEELDHTIKVDCTKKLTAEQWDEFLAKWYDEEQKEFDPSHAYYAMLLRDEDRLALMKEAFEKDLHFLFRAMAVHEYSPHSLEVVELLEKGAEKYPDLRSEVLYSIYMLGFPLNKWHFTSSKEDLMVLRQVISLKSLNQEQVIEHILELVQKDFVPEYDSGNLLKLLMEEKLIEKDDFCDWIRYQEACSVGNVRYLERARQFCPTLLPDQTCINEAAKEGHDRVIEFSKTVLGIALVPSQQAIDDAAKGGKLETLQKRCNEWKRFPSIKGGIDAAKNGHLDTLKWMAGLDPPLYPTQDGANGAAKNGHLDVLRWMKSLERPIIPTERGANDAASRGHLGILKWMVSLARPIYPTNSGANWAAESGHLDVLRWMESLKEPIYPDEEGANDASMKGHLDVLKWMASLQNPIYPTLWGANAAAKNGQLDVLGWMASLEKPILATESGANVAARNGHLDVLKWMTSLEEPIYPTDEGANWAAKNGHLGALKWMASLGRPIYPTTRGATWAKVYNRFDILEWMATLVPPVYPD